MILQLLSHEDLRPIGTAQVTHLVDTCVFLDFFTMISAMKNKAAEHSRNATLVAMRNAAWCAMACDERRLFTATLLTEAGRKILTESRPGTWNGLWTVVTRDLVFPHVVPGWTPYLAGGGGTVSTADGERETTNDERDTFMIELAKPNKLEFISSDRPALKRARAMGVCAWTPREFAEKTLRFDIARDRFRDRLVAAADRLVVDRGASAGLVSDLEAAIGMYETIWDG